MDSSNLSSDSDVPSPEKKRQKVSDQPRSNTQPKKKKTTQLFRDAWLVESCLRDWLRKVPDNLRRAKCSFCKCQITADHSVLMKHLKSETHIRNTGVSNKTQKTLPSYVQPSTKLSDKIDDAVKTAEIKLVGFFAEHNIALKGLDHLSDLLKTIFPDSKIAQQMTLKRTKATGILKNVIGETEKTALTKILKETKFSILTDESTDISTTKSSCIIVRYYDEKEEQVKSKLWDLVECLVPGKITSATGEQLYSNMVKSFKDRQIPLDNVVGFGFDGCNVMMGEKNSVASRLRKDFPGITIFKCICHSLNLCASEACKMLPRSVEDLARNTFNFFAHSCQRKCELVEFQMFTDTPFHKLLHPAQTRWLSLTLVVDRMLEQWDALHFYFKGKWLETKLVAAQKVFEDLDDPYKKLYFIFLNWVLPKITRTNQLYQSSKVVITDLHESMTRLYQELLCSYMDEAYIRSTLLENIDPNNTKYFKPTTNIYLGGKFQETLAENKYSEFINKHPEGLQHVLTSCRGFLIEACQQIMTRYDFKNPLMKLVKQLKPKNALGQAQRGESRTLIPLIKLAPRVCSSNDYQKIDDEWRHLLFHKFDDDINKNLEIDIFWGKFYNLKTDGGEHLFKNLAQCDLALLSLPHSNCDSERIFSKVNNTKTKLRNRMIIPTVRGYLLTSQHVKSGGGKAWNDCVTFIPSKEMLSRMTKDSLYDKPKKKALSVAAGSVNFHSEDENNEDEYEVLFDEM